MRFQVVLTEDTERDLDDIVTHIAKHARPRVPIMS
jgi:plasmid stabilization system protein ParE